MACSKASCWAAVSVEVGDGLALGLAEALVMNELEIFLQAVDRAFVDNPDDVLDALTAVAERHERPMAQIALAWLAGRPGVASVVLGARAPEQLAANLDSADVELTADDVRLLDEASDPEPAAWPYGAAGLEQRSRPLD